MTIIFVEKCSLKTPKSGIFGPKVKGWLILHETLHFDKLEDILSNYRPISVLPCFSKVLELLCITDSIVI